MSRARYRNGDTISLQHAGCDSCTPARVNDVLVHEHGCPDEWRDYGKRCPSCGCKFYAKKATEGVCRACRVNNS